VGRVGTRELKGGIRRGVCTALSFVAPFVGFTRPDPFKTVLSPFPVFFLSKLVLLS